MMPETNESDLLKIYEVEGNTNKIKLPAFTLPEIVVSLFLVSIVFMFVMNIYMITNKQAKALAEKNSFFSEYFVTKKILKKDFSMSGLIRVSDDKKSISIYSSGTEKGVNKISYLFDSAYIIRTLENNADTLRPGGVISSIKTINDSLPIVEWLKIRSSYNGTVFFTQLKKDYSSEEILNAIDQY